MVMEIEEAKLIERVKAGDSASFDLLIAGCKTKAYNTALRYLGDEQDALDVLQESLIKVFRSLHQFKGDSKFDTWVYRIVINSCKDFLRKNQKRNQTDSIHKGYGENAWVLDLPDPGQTPEELLESKEMVQLILACLYRMDSEQKEVIVLRDIQGFSYEEISEILDCSLGTVKSRINRGRKKLQELIREQYKG